MDQRQYELFLQSLIGDQVNNEQGECLGKIVDLVIDPDTGFVKSVVLSLGDAPRFGNALSSVPWEALKISAPHEFHGTGAQGFKSDTRDHSLRGNTETFSHFSAYTFPVRRFRHA